MLYQLDGEIDVADFLRQRALVSDRLARVTQWLPTGAWTHDGDARHAVVLQQRRQHANVCKTRLPPQSEAGVGRIQDIQIDKSRRENRDDKENRTVAVRHKTIHFTGRYIDASVRTLQNRWMTLLRITMIHVVTFLAQFIILHAGLSNKDVDVEAIWLPMC